MIHDVPFNVSGDISFITDGFNLSMASDGVIQPEDVFSYLKLAPPTDLDFDASVMVKLTGLFQRPTFTTYLKTSEIYPNFLISIRCI